MLKEFIEKYGTYAKTARGSQLVSPNFTRLSMVNLPCGTAGKKGGKPPKEKAISRRPTVPDEQCCSLIPSVETPLTYSSPLPDFCFWNWQWQGVPSSQEYYPSLPHFFPSPPLADVTNFTRYPYQMSGSTSLFPPFSHPSPGTATCVGQCVDPSKSLQPFVVMFLNSRIKVCAGCKGPHPKGTSSDILPPPHDLCIMLTEPITFINPHTQAENRKIGNGYYHVNSVCIQKKHPSFTT